MWCTYLIISLSFFSCDCFVLKDILQNWSDEDASVILSNLYEVVKPGQRVLVIETVMHTGSHSDERVSCLFVEFTLWLVLIVENTS